MEDIITVLVDALQKTVDGLVADGLVANGYRVTPNDLDFPRRRGYGHLCTPLVSRLETALARPALFDQFTARLTTAMAESGAGKSVRKIEAAPPVFVNFFLDPRVLREKLCAVLERGIAPENSPLAGRRVLVEYVSANPTGPLTIAHGRQAAFGEALARILGECGAEVAREYYLNDEGRQINLLGKSLRARCLSLLGEDASLPEDGYQGEYLVELAGRVVAEHAGRAIPEGDEFYRRRAVEEILALIRRDLEAFGVRFDAYRSQAELAGDGLVERTLDLLAERGAVYRSEGALFLRTTGHGDDKDRVLRKSDGSLTYLAPDIAYHLEKMKRGYDLLINLWGPDHYGYINRLKAAMEILGYDPGRLEIIIVQLTTLYRGKQKVPMSTRQGEFLPLSQLVEELSADVTKFFFLSRKAASHLDFDLELARRDSAENPVYYLKYASARIASLFRNQQEKMPGFRLDPARACLERLVEPEEEELMLALGRFPGVVAAAAQSLEPQVLFNGLMSLVKTFHHYYQRCQVIGPDPDLSTARLTLVSALEKVVRRGLFLLNVEAPSQM